jgi:hypothetical protein
MGHGRTQELIRRAQDRVVNHDSRRALVAVELSHSGAQVLRAARIRLDCVDLGTSVIQAPRELTQSVRAPRDQSHPVAPGSEAVGNGQTKAGPGPDQQQVSAVD